MKESSMKQLRDAPGLSGRAGASAHGVKSLLALVIACSTALAACGGVGGSYAEPAAAIDQIAPGASETVAGLGTYLAALVATAMEMAETKEPLALDGFAPMAPEDVEPAAVTVPGA
jgi:hypothetical protein